jgi:hypothetical protein
MKKALKKIMRNNLKAQSSMSKLRSEMNQNFQYAASEDISHEMSLVWMQLLQLKLPVSTSL